MIQLTYNICIYAHRETHTVDNNSKIFIYHVYIELCIYIIMYIYNYVYILYDMYYFKYDMCINRT